MDHGYYPEFISIALNTQAILGLDFLEQHHCIINTEQKVPHLYGKSRPAKGVAS